MGRHIDRPRPTELATASDVLLPAQNQDVGSVLGANAAEMPRDPAIGMLGRSVDQGSAL
jgi:hypothetical protein